MTHTRSLFSSLDTSSIRPPIIVANDSNSPVFGTEMVHSSTLLLESVLFVPNFSINLLSISKITNDLNCCVTFFPTHCVFQDLQMMKRIGGGYAIGGMHY